MYTPAQFFHVQKEMRLLRITHANLTRAHRSQKQKAERVEEENHRLKREIDQLRKKEAELLEKLKDTEKQRDTYKGMVFKVKRKPMTSVSGKKRGGQQGHTGYGRKKPVQVDHFVRAFLRQCPTCDTPLSRVSATDAHTVTDVPHWSQMQGVITEYQLERQWCAACKKEVQAVPQGTIPGSWLGMNLITIVLAWRYRFREPYNKIAERLATHYGLHVSEGTLVHILNKTKQWLEDYYDKFLEEVRGSPVKHADETGWRVQGDNWWSWVFASKKSTIYTIEESRGGGVARKYLKGATGMLVRDDYRAYEKLPLVQQSCWAHLLRVARDLSEREEASAEVKVLYEKLKTLFVLLVEDLSQPFHREQRQEVFAWYTEDLKKISLLPLTQTDAKKVQTRIKKQSTNLLTALLYPEGVLTNNLAEGDIRKMVVTRKISGGSQSIQGAKTHAVNLSVVETINKRKLPLLDTLQEYLLQGATGKY